jgi:hypothetical protein
VGAAFAVSGFESLHAHTREIAPDINNRETQFMMRLLYNETYVEHIATKMLHQQFH